MRFLKTNIITCASKTICLILTMSISVYIARFIGPHAKGVYYLVVQIAAILATLSLFGIDTAAIYYLGRGYSARRVVAAATALTFLFGLGAAAVFAAASKTQAMRFILPGVENRYILMIAVAVPFMGLVRLYSALTMGFNRYLAFNMLNVSLYLVMAVIFAALAVFLRSGLGGAVVSFISAYIFMSVIYILVIVTSGRMAGDKGVSMNMGGIVGYGARVSLVPILLLLIYRIDSFQLNHYALPSAVGFYSVALSFAELLLFVPESIGTILFPDLSYTAPEDIDSRFASILRVSFALTLALALIFFLSMRHLVPFVYGGLYRESVGVAYILLPGLLAMSGYYLFASYFQAVGRPGFVTVVLAAVLAEKGLLCRILIPAIGPAGAAVSTSVAYLTCFIIFLTAFRRRSRLGVREILVLTPADMNSIRSSLNNILDLQR
jgi:O-antigen/teichoic acid export membrane protein